MFKLLILTISAFVATTWGFPTGAPLDACDSMIPGHNTSLPQSTKMSQTLSLEETSVKAGQTLKMEFKGLPFKGFLLEIRKKGSDQAVGSFVVNENDPLLSTIDCHGNKDSAITHKNADPKTEISLVWRAPAETGSYEILATVVESFSVFWAKNLVGEITVV